jgi:hypothetical protein
MGLISEALYSLLAVAMLVSAFEKSKDLSGFTLTLPITSNLVSRLIGGSVVVLETMSGLGALAGANWGKVLMGMLLCLFLAYQFFSRGQVPCKCFGELDAVTSSKFGKSRVLVMVVMFVIALLITGGHSGGNFIDVRLGSVSLGLCLFSALWLIKCRKLSFT